MSRQIRVLCSVPSQYCTGSKLATDQQTNSDKCHPSHESAFRCMAHYLVSVLGYKRISGREFDPQNGGPIRVLTKESRYGGLLVTGKEGTRFMPDKRNTGNRGVISG